MTRKSEQSGILRRGSACLSCRRRKLRCDGARPVCSPCNTMRRGQECKYDDSSRKSRTQSLREKMEALQAKVQELESNPVQAAANSVSAPWLAPSDDFVDHVDRRVSDPSGYGFDLTTWNATTNDFDPAFQAQDLSSLSFQFGFDSPLDFSSLSASPTPFDPSMSTTLEIPITTDINGQPLITTMGAFSDSSDTSIYDGVSERLVQESSPVLIKSREVHELLIQTFILHRKQCCFYSNTTRFDPSASPSAYQNTPPNVALMSAIYLMGSFFARMSALESQLLEQTLRDVARTMHSLEQPTDTVLALCLLAQYFYFTNRTVEGDRHLCAAKRVAIDAGLHQVSPSATFPFEPEYTVDMTPHNWLERSAIFWQLYTIHNFWLSHNECCVASANIDTISCRHISTPLPVEEGTPFEIVAGNSAIHALFEPDEFKSKRVSITALKAMASAIFDHSLRVHNTPLKDEATWTYRRNTEIALSRLSELVQPYAMRESNHNEGSFIDTSDLYAVQSLIIASTIHLHLDNTMDLKISRAARNVVELINQLSDDDYLFLDPVLSVCWSSIVKVFHRMLDTANKKMELSGPTSALTFTVKYLDHCIKSLLSALNNMSRVIPLAAVLLKNLENTNSPLHPGLRKTLPPPHVEINYDRHNFVPLT
ncbi:hypothetical protein BDN70DRAFT_581202 [Pholiota conissans]|uniref:Zn(2)-C6 fungal-type domain-containing protein n=1 Tax=Pholiota conissans TaxID=109636 RepID=A0A9P6CVL4_9AGAR|nr:hypothetical protein BDN70DRAFT_581202 [Pholiota conissans]